MCYTYGRLGGASRTLPDPQWPRTLHTKPLPCASTPPEAQGQRTPERGQPVLLTIVLVLLAIALLVFIIRR